MTDADRGTLYDAHCAGLQHDHYDLPDDAVYLAVVREQMYGISAVVDENVRELSPPTDLFEEFKRRADEIGHNDAWEAVDFEQQFREHLYVDADAQAGLDRVGRLLDAGRDVVLVCYENTDEKRCHREVLADVLREGYSGRGLVVAEFDADTLGDGVEARCYHCEREGVVDVSPAVRGYDRLACEECLAAGRLDDYALGFDPDRDDVDDRRRGERDAGDHDDEHELATDGDGRPIDNGELEASDGGDSTDSDGSPSDVPSSSRFRGHTPPGWDAEYTVTAAYLTTTTSDSATDRECAATGGAIDATVGHVGVTLRRETDHYRPDIRTVYVRDAATLREWFDE